MKEVLLKTEALTVGYQKRPLIKEIWMSLEKGQTVSLIGPNGAGKSTIIKTLIRQLDSIDGKIYFKNRNITHMSGTEIAKTMAVVLTEPIHSEQMCCREIIETGRYPYTGRFGFLSNKDREIVKQAMQLVQVEALAEQNFKNISDGQRQRVLLARAICQQPSVLILDEPTSFLDIHHKIQFFEILKKLKREQEIGVLISIHELDMAYKVSDYVVCVKENQIPYLGKPKDIFRKEMMMNLYDLNEEMYEEYLGQFHWD